MMYTKLKRSFSNYSDAKFIDFANGVIQDCTDNPNFPDIGVYLADFKSAFDSFVESVPSRNLRNMVNTATKNELRVIANKKAILLTCYVELISEFNEAKLRSSGFETISKPQAKGILGLVKGMSLASNGISQMMIVQCEADPNATLYNVRVSTDEINWSWFGAHNSRKVKVTNLPNGVKLFVQMRLENTHGHSPWSPSMIGMIGVPEVVPSIHE